MIIVVDFFLIESRIKMKNELDKKIISLVDLTSLNVDDDNNVMDLLLKKADTSMGKVAGVCVYPNLLSYIVPKILPKKIYPVSVVNFPSGDKTILEVVEEVFFVLEHGALEVDLVIPYKELLIGNIQKVEDMIVDIRKATKGVLLKVILETGELESDEMIMLASKIALFAGADFLKTSTGKTSVSASLQAVEVMLNEIKKHNNKVGIKPSGGIKTRDEAILYMELAVRLMGSEYLNSKTFRIGASSLVDNILKDNGSLLDEGEKNY